MEPIIPMQGVIVVKATAELLVSSRNAGHLALECVECPNCKRQSDVPDEEDGIEMRTCAMCGLVFVVERDTGALTFWKSTPAIPMRV